MGKAASEATQLRTAKAELRQMEKELSEIKWNFRHYKERATKAEQEADQWRQRFDALLARVAPAGNVNSGQNIGLGTLKIGEAK